MGISNCSVSGCAIAPSSTSIRWGVVHVVLGKAVNLVGHGCAEEQRLTILGYVAEDLADVVDGAHIEDAVGFVEDDGVHVGEVGLAVVQQVEQAAGAGDHARRRTAGAQFVLLLAVADAAANGEGL
jgi:hypothetical protein